MCTERAAIENLEFLPKEGKRHKSSYFTQSVNIDGLCNNLRMLPLPGHKVRAGFVCDNTHPWGHPGCPELRWETSGS